MNLQECYAQLKGNYDEVLSRLMNDVIVKKFLLKFPQDASYNLLISSLEEGKNEEAFRAAHTLKGVCQNLGMTDLSDSVSPLTEELRDGKGNYSPELLEQVKEKYAAAVAAINALD